MSDTSSLSNYTNSSFSVYNNNNNSYDEIRRMMPLLRIAKNWASCVTFGLAILLMYIGFSHFHDCPAESKLPKYLLTDGLVLFLLFLKDFKPNYRVIPLRIRSVSKTAISLCFLGYFLTGVFLIYGLNEANLENKTAKNYCEKSVYVLSVLDVFYMWVRLFIYLN